MSEWMRGDTLNTFASCRRRAAGEANTQHERMLKRTACANAGRDEVADKKHIISVLLLTMLQWNLSLSLSVS